MFNAEFYVNVDAVVAGADRIGTIPERMGGLIERQMYSIVKDIIHDEFETACAIADSDGGFPPRYQQHLMETVDQIIPTVFMDGDDLFINLNLEEFLGDRDDLEKAYHQGAQLEGGGTHWGPYEGQALKNDTAERHIFFEALHRGETSIQVGDKKVHVQPYAWEETIERYLAIWGDKAPQWLFIQFGQEEWAPYIPQYNIIGNIQERINGFAAGYLASLIAQEVEIANRYRSQGLEVGFSGDKGPARVSSGSITVGGKTYRPGRFAPRGGLN